MAEQVTVTESKKLSIPERILLAQDRWDSFATKQQSFRDRSIVVLAVLHRCRDPREGESCSFIEPTGIVCHFVLPEKSQAAVSLPPSRID